MDEEDGARPFGQANSALEFEDSMTRIHQNLGMEIPEWLRH
jgi:hypothetical protein